MKLKNKLKSQRGAMDKVLVTLLLVTIAMIGIVGIEKWSSSHKDMLINDTNSVINKITTE